MARSPPVDIMTAFDDGVAIARSVRTATAGWRAICVRARRRIGANVIGPLSELDLDEEAASIGRVVRDVARSAARDIDTLVFGLFDGIDDGSGPFAGYHVAGVASHGRQLDELMRDPFTPARRFLRSNALDAIAKATMGMHEDLRPLLDASLRFGAAAVTSRFAAASLPHRVIVAFDDDERGRGVPRYAEIIATSRTASAEPLSSVMLRLVHAC